MIIKISRLDTICAVLFLLMLLGCQPSTPIEHGLARFDLLHQGVIKSVTSSEVDKSPWGIHFNGMPFHNLTFAQYDSLDVENLLQELPTLIRKTEELGLKWARISVDWGLIEDNQGNFHWELLDPMIQGLVEAGIEIYPSLHAGHYIHTNNKPPKSEVELEAWLNFIQKAVNRYKSRIEYWEIWNEPNTTWFWGGAPKASEYAELVKRSSELIRAIDPESQIVGGSLARLDVPYADTLFQLGIAEYIDVLSFHPYGVFPEAALKKMNAQVRMPLLYEPVMNPVDGLIDLIEASGKKIALWQGECGYPSAMNGGGWNGTGPFGEKVQAKWILRRAFTDLSYNAKVSAYFMLKESKHPHYDFYNYKGLLTYQDSEPKLGYQVLQNLCAVVNGDFIQDTLVDCQIEIAEAGELYGIRPKNLKSVALKKGETTLIAYWAMTHLQNNVQPGTVNLKVSGLTQKDSFELIDLYKGHRYQATKIEQTNEGVTIMGLPLSDYPYLLEIR